MNECPKCVGYFRASGHQLCADHQKEYDKWANDQYVPQEKCGCGCAEWMPGVMQMSDPPSYPGKLTYRCKKCYEVRTMISQSGVVRIMEREEK